MADLLWVTKSNSHATSQRDVSITLNKNGANKIQTAFRFRNNSFLRFTKNEYVVFATTDTRIYFKEGTSKTGFKLTCKSVDGKSAMFKTAEDLKKFIGDYDLLWDSKEKLNYIDLTKKIEEEK